MADNRLKSLAERIERLMDERDGIQGDIRDIYAEAKSAGYVPKVLRKAITRKRMDPSKRDEEDTILDLYEGALSGPMRKAVAMAAEGASARAIEEATGIDQATVARSVSLNKKSETDDTPLCTGEQLTNHADEAPATPSVGAKDADLPRLAADVLALPPKQAAAVIAVLDALTDDDLEIPPFLRRRA